MEIPITRAIAISNIILIPIPMNGNNLGPVSYPVLILMPIPIPIVKLVSIPIPYQYQHQLMVITWGRCHTQYWFFLS